MEKLTIPAFGERDFCENQTNATARVWSIEKAAGLFEEYRALFLAHGYAEKEAYGCAGHSYAALQRGGYLMQSAVTRLGQMLFS